MSHSFCPQPITTSPAGRSDRSGGFRRRRLLRALDRRAAWAEEARTAPPLADCVGGRDR